MVAILDKIAKLLAKADSAREIGSVAEAETFAMKAQELLNKHQLEDKDLQEFLEKKSDEELEGLIVVRRTTPTSRKRAEWKQALARVIAKHNGCKILVATGTDRVWFVGEELAAELSVAIFDRLVPVFQKEAQRTYDREYNKLYDNGLSTSSMRGFMKWFLFGAVSGLNKKLEAQAAAQVTSTALIRLTGAVTRYIEKNVKGTVQGLSSPRGFNHDGFAKGAIFGGSVSTQREIGG